MARTTLASQASTIAALEARLVVAAQVYRDQRNTIRELESKLATRGVIATTSVVTQYRDSRGCLWEKARVGNRAISRMVAGAEHA